MVKTSPLLLFALYIFVVVKLKLSLKFQCLWNLHSLLVTFFKFVFQALFYIAMSSAHVISCTFLEVITFLPVFLRMVLGCCNSPFVTAVICGVLVGKELARKVRSGKYNDDNNNKIMLKSFFWIMYNMHHT